MDINLQNGSRFQTIIIGGGIAGVAAATELTKKNQKVAILQANNYLGGRLKSVNVNLMSGGNVQFDQGASWIHGSSKNHPITALSKKVEGVIMKETDDDKIQIYDQKGEEVDKQADKIWNLYEKLLSKCENFQPQRSMQQAFQQLKEGITKDKYFMYHVSNDAQFQTSGSISDLAANTFDDDEFQGKQMLILSGYQKFAQSLAWQNKVEVYLNQKVCKVIWNNGQNQVVCLNGVSVYAKNVIIAVPIGVLKSNSIQFSPNLPNWKTQAINSIGFGNVCKILLDFSNKNLFKIKTHYISVISDNIKQRGLCTYYLNLQSLIGVPALMTFGLGQNADQAQKMPQGQLKALLAKRLSAFAQKDVSPQDFKIYRTTWRGNPNFLGTYSYASTKTRPMHWQMMAKPIFETNWYFCGQHTTSKYRGSVHGAYLSGVFASKSIKKAKQQKWDYPDFKKKGNKRSSSSSSSSSR